MKKKAGVLLLFLAVLLSGCGKKYLESEIIFDDIYRLDGTENMEFTFSKDSTLTVLHKGIYELEENDEGKPIVRICLDDISRELPEDYSYTDYLIKEEDEKILLTFTSEEFDLEESPVTLVHLKGENGLLSGEKFDGVYQLGDEGDSYQYIFKADGNMVMQIKQHYYADEEQMTLSDYAGSTEYLYQVSEDKDTLILMNEKEEPILTLVKDTE